MKAYEQFQERTHGHDREVTIRLSDLATLIDRSMIPPADKQSIIEETLDQIPRSSHNAEEVSGKP